MVTVPLQIKVSVGGLSIHCSAETAIWSVYNQSVQERHGSICLAVFHCELNSMITGINLFSDTVLMCRLDDHKYVINKSSPQTRGMWCCFESFDLKYFHIHICHYKAYRWTHSSSFNLLIVPALKREVCIFKQNSNRQIMLFTVMDVLCWSFLYSSRCFLMMPMAGSMSTDVNSALTS